MKTVEHLELGDRFKIKCEEYIDLNNAHKLKIEENQRLEEEIKDLKR